MIPLARKRAGFSLIELLVILTTLAIVAGLLVPAAAQSNDLAMRQAELGNLRVLMKALHAYAKLDPHNILGPVHPRAPDFINEGFANYGGGPGIMLFRDWNDPFDPRTRPLNDLLYGREGLNGETQPGDRSVFKEFQCLGRDLGWQPVPGLLTDDRETERPYFTANGTSFRQNNMKFSNGKTAGIYARPINRIPAPSLTVGLMEARAFETVWTNDSWGSLGQNVEGGLELKSYHRKLGFFHAAYTDGHAAFADFGNGTYFEHRGDFFFDVRGTWGRMDCFPDEMIPEP